MAGGTRVEVEALRVDIRFEVVAFMEVFGRKAKV